MIISCMRQKKRSDQSHDFGRCHVYIIESTCQFLPYVLVGGIPTPLKNMKVSWDDYSQYTEK